VSIKWLVLETALHAAGSRAGPDEVARELRAAGVHVSRNSRQQWIVSPRDPIVKAWLHGLAYPAEPEPERLPDGVHPDDWYFDDAPGGWARGLEPAPRRGTGRHVFPPEVAGDGA